MSRQKTPRPLPDPPGVPAGSRIAQAYAPEAPQAPEAPAGPPPGAPAEFHDALGAGLSAPQGDVSGWAAHQARRVLAELAARRAEALALYEPLPEQEKFHKSRARNRLVIGSNRSGKTLSAAAEFARAVCGKDPHGKYPPAGGLAFAVGKDQKHVGTVLYPKLFKPGAFHVIRDEATGLWRGYRPWADAAREAQRRPAPPLIPRRLIAETAWENKKENVPSVVRLTNGWEVCFFSSLGKPPQGQAGDLAWLDEEIVDPAWYPELAARMASNMGRLVWSATPQSGTDQLFELHERAEKERATLEPSARSIEEFFILLSDNKHMSEDAKAAFARDLNEEEYRVRVLGEYAITGYKVYPTFSMAAHGYDEGEVPQGWTRYCVVDPGHRVCAALFAAVPPPEEGDFVLLYDEVYVREATAESFADAMSRAIAGDQIQAFVMDSHMALHTELGVGQTVMQQYSAALAARGVKSVATGPGFLLASDDVSAGILAVQGWLRGRDGKPPRLKVMRGRLPNFLDEVKRYHRKRVAGRLTGAPDQRKDNHLMDCLRYLALYDPRHVPASPRRQGPRGALKQLREKQARKKAQGLADSGVNLGPGVSACR
jgi:hypothetical protein